MFFWLAISAVPLDGIIPQASNIGLYGTHRKPFVPQTMVASRLSNIGLKPFVPQTMVASRKFQSLQKMRSSINEAIYYSENDKDVMLSRSLNEFEHLKRNKQVIHPDQWLMLLYQMLDSGTEAFENGFVSVEVVGDVLGYMQKFNRKIQFPVNDTIAQLYLTAYLYNHVDASDGIMRNFLLTRYVRSLGSLSKFFNQPVVQYLIATSFFPPETKMAIMKIVKEDMIYFPEYEVLLVYIEIIPITKFQTSNTQNWQFNMVMFNNIMQEIQYFHNPEFQVDWSLQELRYHSRMDPDVTLVRSIAEFEYKKNENQNITYEEWNELLQKIVLSKHHGFHNEWISPDIVANVFDYYITFDEKVQFSIRQVIDALYLMAWSFNQVMITQGEDWLSKSEKCMKIYAALLYHLHFYFHPNVLKYLIITSFLHPYAKSLLLQNFENLRLTFESILGTQSVKEPNYNLFQIVHSIPIEFFQLNEAINWDMEMKYLRSKYNQ